MIPAPPGTTARYYDDEEQHLGDTDVIAFDDDGTPLVLGNHGLIPAGDLSPINQCRIDIETPAIVGVIPGCGWLIERDDRTTIPVVAFTIDINGFCTPLAFPNGATRATPLRYIDHARTARLVHPDHPTVGVDGVHPTDTPSGTTWADPPHTSRQ